MKVKFSFLALALGISLAIVFVSRGGSAGAQVAGDPVFLGAGDIGNCLGKGDEATAALVKGIEGTVFTTGDNAYPDGSNTDFANCYDPGWGQEIKARTWPALGNHEYNTAGASGYFNYFGSVAGDSTKGYYSHDLGSWHIIVLNSNCSQIAGGCDAGSPQEQWLKDDLALHPNVCTLAYWHHPRFSSGSHGNLPDSGVFWNDLYRAGADVVLNGHDHSYERFAPQNPSGVYDPAQGIREFVVGTGGAAFTGFGTAKPNSEKRIARTNGVLKMTLHPDGYDWQFVTAPGATVADSGGGQCHGVPLNSPTDVTAPAVQPPRQDLTVSSTLGTSTIPTKVSWSGQDEGSGVTGYEVQQSTNGGAFTAVSLPTATSTSKILQLQPGGTYQFRARATDGAYNTSAWATGPEFLVDPHQEDDLTAIVYSGNWTPQASTSVYGGGLYYAGAKGDTAQFSFAGRNVAWVSAKGPDRGKAAVSVDGVVVQTVDLYASAPQPKRVVFTKSDLDPTGGHTVTVQALGTKNAASSATRVDVDAFVALR
jgi:hypothetical protein